MCCHEWITINDITVCRKCGLTRMYDGKVFFDRKLPNYKPKKRRKGKNKR